MLIVILALSQAGCGGPTYPKESLPELMTKLCRDEYGVDVKVDIKGATLYIYMPQEDLLDYTKGILPEAEEKINNVMLSATRVALSTDAEFRFFCIITQDPMVPEIELVLIRYIEDIKRFLYHDISRQEYFDRFIVDMKMTPQGQREKEMRSLFIKLKIDDKWAQAIIKDYFDKHPVEQIRDIGYWGDRFFTCDIVFSEFLAEQMGQRINMKFKKELNEKYGLRQIDAKYNARGGKEFEVTIEAAPNVYTVEDFSSNIFDVVLRQASRVIHDYRFKDFTAVKVFDWYNGRQMHAAPDELEKLLKGRLTVSDLKNEGYERGVDEQLKAD